VILGAVYVLWAYQRMWQGEPSRLEPADGSGIRDLSAREWLVLAPLIAAILILGLFPGPLLDRIQPAAEQVVELTAGQPS
jgi:NADH-quinone oxidoreductase subunit M